MQESQVAEYGASPVYGATGITGYTEAADVNGESILIIKDGSGVGTVKYVTGEYSYIGTLNRLIAKDGYYLKYIYFALQGFSFEPTTVQRNYPIGSVDLNRNHSSDVLV